MTAGTIMEVDDMSNSPANRQLAIDLYKVALGVLRTQHVLGNATSTFASTVRSEDQRIIAKVIS